MNELKLKELKHELEGTKIHVNLVDGALDVLGDTELGNTITFTIHDEKLLNMSVSNIVVYLIETVTKAEQIK